MMKLGESTAIRLAKKVEPPPMKIFRCSSQIFAIGGKEPVSFLRGSKMRRTFWSLLFIFLYMRRGTLRRGEDFEDFLPLMSVLENHIR